MPRLFPIAGSWRQATAVSLRTCSPNPGQGFERVRAESETIAGLYRQIRTRRPPAPSVACHRSGLHRPHRVEVAATYHHQQTPQPSAGSSRFPRKGNLWSRAHDKEPSSSVPPPQPACEPARGDQQAGVHQSPAISFLKSTILDIGNDRNHVYPRTQLSTRNPVSTRFARQRALGREPEPSRGWVRPGGTLRKQNQ